MRRKTAGPKPVSSFTPTAVLSVDLALGIRDLQVPSGYRQAQVLIRYRGTPICNPRLKAIAGCIRGVDLWSVAWNHNGARLRQLVLRDAMGIDGDSNSTAQRPLPTATIVVCTRNRTFDLRRCLNSIVPQLSDTVQAVVIDNNPSDDSTEKLVSGYPVRYYRENRPGLNWARARAAKVATTELLLYTDDDVVLDRNWATQMRIPFADEHVAAVTGAVVSMEFENRSQELYQTYGGFERGYDQRTWNLMNTPPAGAGRAGAGASMAFRRALVLEMRLFECEFDCGTAAHSGGDFYAFYQLIRAGYNIAYWPEALAWHRHRQTLADLQSMLYGYGVGLYCAWLHCMCKHRDLDALLVGATYFKQYHLREFVRALLKRPGARPLDLIWAEIRGVFHAPFAYRVVRKRERQLGPLELATAVESQW